MKKREPEVRGLVLKRMGLVGPRETLPIAVIVTGRNYARFLGDCIESVQRQEPGPSELLYVDNGSHDASVSIARERGVRVVRMKKQANINPCRNRGAVETTQPFLLFLDADDLLSRGYLKALFDNMKDGRVAVAYPHLRKIGPIREVATPAPSWGRTELLRDNFIQTSALIRRVAFEQVRGFDESLPCFQDWDLWLRITANRWHVAYVPNAILDHRSHADSLTSNVITRLWWYQEILSRQPVTLFTPFGPGRPIIGFQRYVQFLESYGVNWDKTTLFFYDNTGSPRMGRMLQRYLARSPAQGKIYYRDDHQVSYHDIKTRIDVMPQRMCEMWSRAAEMFHGDFIMSVEDDTEPEEPGAFRRLFEGMVPNADAVTGVYNSRPIVDSNIELVRDWKVRADGSLGIGPVERYPGDLDHPPADGCQDIGASGVGCLLLRREAIAGYDYEVNCPGSWVGQDFGLFRHIKDRGRRTLAHWGVRCRHWYTKDHYT